MVLAFFQILQLHLIELAWQNGKHWDSLKRSASYLSSSSSCMESVKTTSFLIGCQTACSIHRLISSLVNHACLTKDNYSHYLHLKIENQLLLCWTTSVNTFFPTRIRPSLLVWALTIYIGAIGSMDVSTCLDPTVHDPVALKGCSLPKLQTKCLLPYLQNSLGTRRDCIPHFLFMQHFLSRNRFKAMWPIIRCFKCYAQVFDRNLCSYIVMSQDTT